MISCFRKSRSVSRNRTPLCNLLIRNKRSLTHRTLDGVELSEIRCFWSCLSLRIILPMFIEYWTLKGTVNLYDVANVTDCRHDRERIETQTEVVDFNAISRYGSNKTTARNSPHVSGVCLLLYTLTRSGVYINLFIRKSIQ